MDPHENPSASDVERAAEEHRLLDALEFGSDDPQPGDPDFDSMVPPYVAVVTDQGGERRLMLDPEEGGVCVGRGHGRVYRLGVDDLVRMANMGFLERRAYVAALDLGRLALVEESFGGKPSDPFQLPLALG